MEKSIECDDAISRKLAIRAIKNLYPDIPRVDFNGAKRKWADKYAQYIECERLIEQLPSVTQKSGKWIIDGSVDCYLDKVRCHCSECGKKKKFPADYDHIKQELSISYKYPQFIDNYCPNCGAKMVEPQESEDNE